MYAVVVKPQPLLNSVPHDIPHKVIFPTDTSVALGTNVYFNGEASTKFLDRY
jgi:hypothetical protein